MANTLKFGNGEWYGKKDTILAYNDLNSNYKPLPFNFSRASKATVINKDGLIEEVGSGQPRVDYLNNTKGAMLLEPSRTNLITQSEAFTSSYWTKNGASIQGDPSTVGSELVANGNFATDSDWIISGSNLSISNGKGISTGSNFGAQFKQTILQTNKTYKLTFDIVDYTSGSIGLTANYYGAASQYSSVGTHTTTFTSLSQTEFRLYSQDFVGSIDNVSVKEVQGFTSPDGTNNAYKLVEDTSTGIHQLTRSITNTVANQYSISVFVKENTRNWIRLSSGDGGYVFFNISDNTIGIQTNAVGVIEDIGNGWKRCKITFTAAGTNGSATLRIAESDGVVSYVGQNKSVYVYAMQYEEGSYATSYIPTSGSVVTRLADECNNAGNEQVINSTEGVLYAEMSALTSFQVSTIMISLSNGGSSAIRFGYQQGTSVFFVESTGAANNIGIYSEPINSLIYSKIALSYKENDVKLYINGFLVATDSVFTPFTSNVLNKLSFDNGVGVSDFYGNVKDVRVYNTALTDQELIALTTI